MFTKVGLICLLASAASALTNLTLVNNSPDKDVLLLIAEGIEHNPSDSLLLPAGKTDVLQLSESSWTGRIWGRTDCLSVADCLGRIPTTLVEVSITSFGTTFYDVSIIKGFNIKATIEPVDADGNKVGDKVECTYDILEECPEDLQVINSEGVVACVDNEEDGVGEWFAERCPTATTSALEDGNKLHVSETNNFLITFL